MPSDVLRTLYDIDAAEYEDEGLLTRNEGDQLIRLNPATDQDFRSKVKVTIDGHDVEVARAVPVTDSQGNIIRDEDGRPKPRATTIYDAAMQVYGKLEQPNPIPVLCHQEHMTPVAVCRVCVVQIQRMALKRPRPGEPPTGEKELKRERKLLPACQHRIEDGMIIDTLGSPNEKERERLKIAVGMLTELLTTDQLTGGPEQRRQPFNELAILANNLGIKESRFPKGPENRGKDDSSLCMAINHDSCILCNRCVRACDEVKENSIIGRSGKGYSTKISFDLGEKMGQSNCVSCGECMISCPTDAITFHRPVMGTQTRISLEIRNDAPPVPVDVLRKMHPLFASLPYKFLQWNAHSVVLRKIKRGEVLCREGEQGATAFIMLKGRFGISIKTSIGEVKTEKAKGILGWLGRVVSVFQPQQEGTSYIRTEGAVIDPRRTQPMVSEFQGVPFVAIRDPEDVLLGEMACLNNYPRSATMVAVDDGEVLEIGRNVLYMLQRTKTSRDILNRVYREHVLSSHLQTVDFFKHLSIDEQLECIEYLRERIELLRLDPGQVVFRQNEIADALYLIRIGFIRVARTIHNKERVLDYRGPGTHFGEIALVAKIDPTLREYLPKGMRSGERTAGCTALDHVEIVKINEPSFRYLYEKYPALREYFHTRSRELLKETQTKIADPLQPLEQYIDQGLFNAKNLLVLDLERCTRCDECTKACAAIHSDGVSRLLREGLRFERFLVATSCRSCQDPLCMIGCPVDAIHWDKKKDGHIKIENHCIGCSQCANNCPYGNIQMVENPDQTKKKYAPKLRAITCDLCQPIVGDGTPNCVYACPHDAAFRMSGRELQELTIVKKS